MNGKILEDNYWLYEPEAGTLYNRENWEIEAIDQYDQINGSYEYETSDWSWDKEKIYNDGYWDVIPEQGSLWNIENSTEEWVDRYDGINGTYGEYNEWFWSDEFLGDRYSETAPY